MSAVVAPPAGDVAALPEASISLPAVPQSFESKKNAIYFFAPNSDYGFLSTFSPHSFKLNDSVWKTVEHYFQAQKFAGTPLEVEIKKSADPVDARDIAKDHESDVRPDFEDAKEMVMRDALMAKFTQNEKLGDELIATLDATLVDHSKKDSYWGDGHANGLNRLGFLLMDVRTALRALRGLPEPTESFGQVRDKATEAELKAMLADLMAKSEVIDEEGIITDVGTQASSRHRRTRASRPTQAFRHADGTSVFEKDPETGGMLVDGISVPSAALTPAAHFVAHQFQFEKRNHQAAGYILTEEEIEELEEDDPAEIDFETELEYAPPKPESMDDIRDSQALEQLMEESELAMVMAASLDDHTGDDFAALQVQLRSLQKELHKHVDHLQDEAMLDRVLSRSEDIDAICGQS